MALISTPTAMARKLQEAQSRRLQSRFESFSWGLGHLGEMNADRRRLLRFSAAFLFSPFPSKPRFFFFSFFFCRFFSACPQINEWMGDKPRRRLGMRKRAWVELEAPPEKQTSGRSKAGPGLFEPTDGIGFSASVLAWLGLGGPFARFKFAAHAVARQADAPTPKNSFELALLAGGRTNAL